MANLGAVLKAFRISKMTMMYNRLFLTTRAVTNATGLESLHRAKSRFKTILVMSQTAEWHRVQSEQHQSIEYFSNVIQYTQ